MLFSYQCIASKRKYKGKKPLVETNGKYGFDLKNIHSHNKLYIFFNEMARALPFFPLAPTDPIDGGGITSFPPDQDSGTSLVT